MGTRAGREGPGRPRSSRADGSRWTCGASRSGCTATQTKAFLSIPASEIAAKLSREPQRQTSAPPPKRTHSLCYLKKKERKKEKCSICQNTTGTLSDCFQLSSACLPNLENPTGTHGSRTEPPCTEAGEGRGRPENCTWLPAHFPKEPKPQEAPGEVSESTEVDEPLLHVDAFGPGGGGHPVHPHALATPPRLSPLLRRQGERPSDPPPSPLPSSHRLQPEGGRAGRPWRETQGQGHYSRAAPPPTGAPAFMGRANPGAAPGRVGKPGSSQGRRDVKGYARGYPAPTHFPPSASPGMPMSPGVTDGQWRGEESRGQQTAPEGGFLPIVPPPAPRPEWKRDDRLPATTLGKEVTLKWEPHPRPGLDCGTERWKQPPQARGPGPGLPVGQAKHTAGCVIPLSLMRSGRNKTSWLQKGK